MNSAAVSHIISRIDSFPTLPVVVSQVMDITSDPNSAPKDLFDVISRDQSLTTTILKVANSPFFGVIKRVASLNQAIPLLGFSEIRNLVLGKAVFNSFKGLKSDTRLDLESFWRHAFACGLAAKILTGGKGNEVFVAGLIHDIGKLVICIAFPDLFSKIMERSEHRTVMTHLIEVELLGMSHDEIGMLLLKKWMFPNVLLNAVGYHHRPLKKPELYPIAVHLGDCLAHMSNENLSSEWKREILREYFGPGIKKAAADCGVNWDEAVFREYMDAVKHHLEEEQGTFEKLVA